MDVETLTQLLREAEKRHGEYEPTAPKHHWSGWYAAFIVARERGKTSDEAVKSTSVHGCWRVAAATARSTSR